jgi:hypothetical protein
MIHYTVQYMIFYAYVITISKKVLRPSQSTVSTSVVFGKLAEEQLIPRKHKKSNYVTTYTQ